MNARPLLIAIIAMMALIFTSYSALAQTAVFTCDFDSTSCGFDLSPSNGVLNVTSTTSLDWDANLYTWSNISAKLYCPTGGNGNKIHVANAASDWLLDGTTWKNEPSYAIGFNTNVNLDAWDQINIVTNHTANTSRICVDGACSSAGAFAINPATQTMQIETTYAGGDCAYDNMTIYVLDSEAPEPPAAGGCSYNGTGSWSINASNCTTIGAANNLLGNAVTVRYATMTLNSSASIFNFSSFTAYSTVINRGGRLG